MLVAAKVLLTILSIVLVIVVLLQSGRSAGLSGVISGGGDQALNRRPKGVDTILMRVTVVLAVLFFALTLLIAYMGAHHLG